MHFSKKTRQAAILTLFAFLLPVLLIMLGFSVDMAYMQLVQTEMRLAADNTARVAADNLSRYEDETLATNAALDVAKNFTVAGKPLRLSANDIDFGRATPNIDGVFVFDTTGFPPNAVRINSVRNAKNADGTVPLFFSSLIGNGQYSPQSSATASFLNMDICLVLDRSTSMKLDLTTKDTGMSISDPRFCSPPNSTSRWASLKNAMHVFCDTLAANSSEEQIAIVTYASDLNKIMRGLCGRTLNATIDLDLTVNLKSVKSKIDDISSQVWNGNTEIYSGMDKAITVLSGAKARKYSDKVMIVLTDGYPTAGDAIASAAAAAAQHIRVYTVTFGVDADQAYMKLVAQAGEGVHAHASDEATLIEIFENFAAKATVLID